MKKMTFSITMDAHEQCPMCFGRECRAVPDSKYLCGGHLDKRQDWCPLTEILTYVPVVPRVLKINYVPTPAGGD